MKLKNNELGQRKVGSYRITSNAFYNKGNQIYGTDLLAVAILYAACLKEDEAQIVVVGNFSAYVADYNAKYVVTTDDRRLMHKIQVILK